MKASSSLRPIALAVFSMCWFGGFLTPAGAQVAAAKLALLDASGQPASAAGENRVLGWGANYAGQLNVPKDLTDVIAVSAGDAHSVALKRDGTIVGWGNEFGQLEVPDGLRDVVSITTGSYRTLALKSDGTVVAWGPYDGGDVPAGLRNVVAVAAGFYHSVALKSDGTLVTWGYNSNGQTRTPPGLGKIAGIAAGQLSTIAIRRDGTAVTWGDLPKAPAALKGVSSVAAGVGHALPLGRDGTVSGWGDNSFGELNQPPGLNEVVAIDAGFAHSLALRSDGTVVAWGDVFFKPSDDYGQASLPEGLSGVTAIAAGLMHTLAVVETSGAFGVRHPGETRDHIIFLQNEGSQPLSGLNPLIAGPDGDQFTITTALPATVASGEKSPFTLRFAPTRLGPLNAVLKIYSNDPEGPSVILLHGTGSINATKPGSAGSPFTCAPLRLDRSTGLLLQKIVFSNTVGVALKGLRLRLSNVAAGATVYSSSPGIQPGTLEVLYSHSIAGNETISFDLVYSDPKRRTAASINPTIMAEALESTEPAPGPVMGTLVPLLGTTPTPQGPMLQWNTKPSTVYVVEYSDDGGKTWFSAMHRLGTTATRMFWVDRGQPETQTTPTGTPNQLGGRFYRVKKL